MKNKMANKTADAAKTSRSRFWTSATRIFFHKFVEMVVERLENPYFFIGLWLREGSINEHGRDVHVLER